MRKLLIAIAVAGLVGLCLWMVMAGCGKKPTEPTEPKEYRAYFIDETSHNQYYYYSTATGLVDSFYLPYNSYETGIAISPDGKTMYLNPDGSIVEVSLDSHKVIAEHPVSFSHVPSLDWKVMEMSPDGQYLAILTNKLILLNLSDYSIFYEETKRCKRGRFSTEGSLFTCIIKEGDDTVDVLVVDMIDGSAEIIRDFDNGSPFDAIYCESREMWFLYYSLGNSMYGFQAIDEKTDSVVYSIAFCPGSGDMEITPDNNYVFFSQPGGWQFGCPPPQYFNVYDISENQLEQIKFKIDTVNTLYRNTNEIVITPDGRHLIGTSLFLGQVMDYDIQSGQFLHRFEFDRGSNIRTLSIQKNP